MSSTPSTLTPTISSPFLSLPSELRLKIYTYVLTSSEPITITPSSPTSHQFFQFLSFDIELDFSSLSSSSPRTPSSSRTTTSPKLLPPSPSVSAQFLRTSRLIHTEATPILYTSNTFNCSSRSALPILLQTLTPTTSPLLTHLILDWDQLQDFSWSLSKPATVHATSGLRTLDLATWRMRVVGGSSSLWRDVKSYERQICQAALDITRKHPRLKVVLQRTFHKRSNLITGARASIVPNTWGRIKWRFVTEQAAAAAVAVANEKVVDLQDELDRLSAS
ncbi:hypothetical protein LTR67_003697 [Exophiala xenobiotica]